MNLVLPGTQKQWIQEPQENAELRRLRLEKLGREIQIGIDQLDRGEGIPFNDEFAEQLKRRGREQLQGFQIRRGLKMADIVGQSFSYVQSVSFPQHAGFQIRRGVKMPDIVGQSSSYLKSV